MRRLIVLAVALLLVAGCSAEPSKPVQRTSPPPAGLSILYATTGPTDTARISRFEIRSETNALYLADEEERFGELIGRNSTRGEKERALGVWVQSPSGRHLARLTFTDLQVASAEDPLAFRRIAKAPSTGHSLGGTAGVPDASYVLWSADESRLFYLESRKGPKPPPNTETYGAPAEMSLYEVMREGSGRRLIKRFSTPKFVNLLGSDARNIYWVETGEGGGVSDLTAVSLADGKTRRVDPLSEGLPSTWIKVSPAGDKAYVIEQERRIVEIALPAGTRKVVHEGDPGTMPIESIEISPEGRRIVYSERDEGPSTVRMLSLADGRSTTLWENKSEERPPGAWSPDGRYLVLHGKEDCGTSNDPHLRVVDLETGDILRLKLDRVTCPAEATDAGHPRLIFIAWLLEGA